MSCLTNRIERKASLLMVDPPRENQRAQRGLEEDQKMMEVSAKPNRWRLSVHPKTETDMEMRMKMNRREGKVKQRRI